MRNFTIFYENEFCEKKRKRCGILREKKQIWDYFTFYIFFLQNRLMRKLLHFFRNEFQIFCKTQKFCINATFLRNDCSNGLDTHKLTNNELIYLNYITITEVIDGYSILKFTPDVFNLMC